MNEIPKRFDELLDYDFKWTSANLNPHYFENVEFIRLIGDYELYVAWDYNRKNGVIYRVKKKKCCDKCGQELK